MKKILPVIAALVMLSSVSFAGVNFGLQVTGANLNFEDPTLKELYGFGFGGGVHFDIDLPLILAIRVQGDYTTFGLDNTKAQAQLVQAAATLGFQTNPADFAVDGGRINILSVNVNGKLNPLPLPLLSPYITAGGGLASVSSSDINVKYTGNQPLTGGTLPGAKAETNASANLGVGVDLDLIAVKLYLEAKYTWIFVSGGTSTYVPVSLGITF